MQYRHENVTLSQEMMDFLQVERESLFGRDFYSELGVERCVSQEDLKAAYKKQAMRWHPDRLVHLTADSM